MQRLKVSIYFFDVSLIILVFCTKMKLS